MKIKSLLTGIITGSLIASTITLLTTPTSGKNVQHRCQSSLKDVQKALTECNYLRASSAQQLRKTITISKQQMKSFAQETNESIQTYKTDVEPTLAQLKEDIHALQQTVKQGKVTNK